MSGAFVSCDWGTTHLRLRLLSADCSKLLAEISSDAGVAAVAAGGDDASRPMRFRKTLCRQIEQLAKSSALGNAPIVISGMASASIGWHELPYAPTPWRLDGSDAVVRELEPLEWSGGRQRVLLLSGLRTANDVMRGEETQVLGLFQLAMTRQPASNCIVVLPGTHSKHVQVEAGAIVDFRTYMTGELFEVLGRHSILRHSVAGEADAALHGLQAFFEGVELSREMPLSAALFRVRTRQVLDGREPLANHAYLSGILIGGELAELAGGAESASPIAICASGPLGQAYAQAARVLGLADRLQPISDADVGRLASLGQVCVARRLGVS
jgi:2-dehydro-3-deoxygalactonokinase